ncbi:MAG: flagellar filament capping protein FliD [Phycisphaerales bacterium]
MSGINTSTGLVSGIDYSGLINQLLQIEARPRALAQQRIVQLQSTQAAFLDLNSRLGSLKSAASRFRTENIFRSATVTSTNQDVLTGSASSGAALGGFSFIVSQTVGTQQVLSRGFADRNVSGLGATSITIESERARLDTDTRLADLRGGAGIERGRIVVTDHGGRTETIELSRVASVGEVLDRLNNAQTVRIRARAEGDRLVIEDQSGVAGTLRIENAAGSNTATSLGISGTGVSGRIEGQRIYHIGDGTSLQSFNDGNGIRFNNAIGAIVGGVNPTTDFTVKTRDGTTFGVDIGEIWETIDGKLTKTASAVSDFAGLKARIESQTAGKVSVQTTSDGRGIRLVDSSTPTGTDNFEVIDISGAASDLRIVGSTATDTLSGAAVLAGMNTTLASNLSGGAGLASGAFEITTRSGAQHSFSVSVNGSVGDILREISEQTGGNITATLNSSGVGLVLTDNTTGSGNLIVGGQGAVALGVATEPAGVAAATVRGSRLQHRYMSESTLVSSLNGGRGIGTGTFEIIGPDSQAVVDIGADTRNLADLIAEINSKNIGVRARINDNGDGLLIERAPGSTGAQAISIRDLSGTVARSLNIVGTAANNTDRNFVDGSFERTIEVGAADTLDQVVSRINNARAGATASVIRDGSGANPFRLQLTATKSGREGAFTIEAEGTDLGLSTISQARNARVFFGSDDASRAVLVESSTNTIDGVIDGLTINARSASETPVTLTVARDNSAIETAINSFVSAFNDVVSRIDRYTSYEESTNTRGTLLGDSTANELRRALFDQVLKPAKGVSGAYKYLSQIGIKVGSGGTLSVDSGKLQAALSADPDSVAELFAARTQATTETRREVSPGIFVLETPDPDFTALGIGEQFSRLIDTFTSAAGGSLSRRRTSLDTEIAAQRSRISAIDSRLTTRRTYLTQQFAQLESTLANLQRQQNSLGSLGLSVGAGR